MRDLSDRLFNISAAWQDWLRSPAVDPNAPILAKLEEAFLAGYESGYKNGRRDQLDTSARAGIMGSAGADSAPNPEPGPDESERNAREPTAAEKVIAVIKSMADGGLPVASLMLTPQEGAELMKLYKENPNWLVEATGLASATICPVPSGGPHDWLDQLLDQLPLFAGNGRAKH